MTSSHPQLAAINAALATVMDPELGRPITELKMVGDIVIDDPGQVSVTLLLTTSVCPLQERFTSDVEQAVMTVAGVNTVDVKVAIMDDEQRSQLRDQLGGASAARPIPFAAEDNHTRVIAIASGKGGVGKSSITVNLAVALAGLGQRVGIIDADVYGHSTPDLLGVPEGEGPTMIEGMNLIVPVEVAGIKLMSIGMMKPSRDQVVAWRGPVVDRAINQFLADVYWGELDYLLLDLPPGTGDIAIGLGQKLPKAEVIVVTTPQQAATEVAERAGTMAGMLHQPVLGVIENMSYLDYTCPDCGKTHRINLFGSGGGSAVAASLSERLGYTVPLLAQLPLEQAFRVAGDQGHPATKDPQGSPVAQVITGLAGRLVAQGSPTN
ncbi:MAG: Mrp/NBP35 family ATP-binding protein [Propionibacteriaceae bacterium]|jgi:ATP-binding protein involved in chromosome partitioning|nr:Mrp/NBP35 family ATP-binding protein [Propionibacteriaceae bacterium]